MLKDPKYDLEERTAKFGEGIIKFARQVWRDSVTWDVITQFVNSGTAVGAIYCEADDAESKKDFKHKIGMAKKKPGKLNIGYAWLLWLVPF